MFERNKVDNVDQSAVPVEIETDTGEVMTGRLLVPIGRALFETLNSQGGFLEFEPYGGEKAYVAKSMLRHVRLISVTRAPSLSARARDLDGFDPHTILGVPATAAFDDIKTAWHRLSKRYHPDRYANVELPDEVRDYLAVMARRVNAAFAALEKAHASQKRVAEGRSAPIYANAPRV